MFLKGMSSQYLIRGATLNYLTISDLLDISASDPRRFIDMFNAAYETKRIQRQRIEDQISVYQEGGDFYIFRDALKKSRLLDMIESVFELCEEESNRTCK